MAKTLVVIRVGDGHRALLFDEQHEFIEDIALSAVQGLTAGQAPTYGADSSLWDDALDEFGRLARENARLYDLP